MIIEYNLFLSLQTLQWSPTAVDSKPIFHQSVVPCPLEVNNMLGLTIAQYERLIKESTANQAQELALDKTICPITISSISFVNFRYAKWSPRGGDVDGKCILAGLTLDHRLSLYYTGLGNSNFEVLAELSSIYAEKVKLEDLTFVCVKETAYRISAVELAWSPVVSVKNIQFSILSVGMYNGDVVLWKIKFPCSGVNDCSMITVIKLGSGMPSAMGWCNKLLTSNVACCVVGFDSGIVQAISVNINIPSKTTTINLFDQSDNMKVTTVNAHGVDDDKLTVLATKEVFIMTFEVEVVYKILRLFSSSHTTGDYNCYASGLSYNDGQFLLSSSDGTILKYSKGTSSNWTPVDYKHCGGDIQTTWACFGVAWSHYGLFSVAAFKPSCVSDDRQLRPGTLEVQILPMDTESHERKLKKYLLNDLSLNKIPECLEVFREYLWEGKNPLPEVNDLFSKEKKWFEFPSKNLQILRYFLLAVQVRIPRLEKNKTEELLLSERNICKITDILLCKHISVCLNKVIESKSSLKNNDLIVLLSMVNWMEKKVEMIKLSPLGLTVKKIKAVLSNLNHKFTCCICENEFQIEDNLYKCSDGHVFGMCCQTTLPCMYTVRKCSVCYSVATDKEEVQLLSWLDMHVSHCTFCDGFLV